MIKLRSITCLAAVLGLATLPAAAQSHKTQAPSPPIEPGPYIVVDAHTGEALLQSNAGAPWYPASLTKLMTIYVVFQELKAGNLTLQTPIVFSPYAVSTIPTKLGLAAGQSVTVEQGLEALIAHSANDVAVAFAERISGSEPAFGDRMTKTATSLGMTSTTFGNADGLPNPDNKTTARDLTLLAMALVRDFPDYYGYFRTRYMTFGKRRIGPGVRFVSMYAPYADGLKTGYTCASGYNLVGSAVRDGRRLIGVALGFRRGDQRDEFLVKLFDQAFQLQPNADRPKVWELQNEAGEPTVVFPEDNCPGNRRVARRAVASSAPKQPAAAGSSP